MKIRQMPVWLRVASIAGFAAPLIFVFLILNRVSEAASFSCLDESGRGVDWFIVYKLPRLEDQPFPFNTGLAYAFITSRQNFNGWQVSKYIINDTSSLVRRSLDQVYDRSHHYNYIQYNDDPPVGKGNTHAGHLKGILAIDDQRSFWLQHSVPKFASPFNQTFSYPDNALNNGQHLFCVSLNTKSTIDQILGQLLIMRPSVYAYNADERFLKAHPAMDQLIKRKFSKTKFKQLVIKSAGNKDFQTFAKSPQYELELYAQLVAPALHTNLSVQSWRNGSGGKLNSSCSTQFDVFNVQLLGLGNSSDKENDQLEINTKSNYRKRRRPLKQSGGPIQWKSTEDHSKWASSDDEKKPFSCLSDINRMHSQLGRGGGAICVQDKAIWKTLNTSVKEVEPCPRSRFNKPTA